MKTEVEPLCRNCIHGCFHENYMRMKGKRVDRVICRHPKVFGEDEFDSDGICVGYAAELHFGPDFGCIHFESEQKNNTEPVEV